MDTEALFNDDKKWRQYPVSWCGQCDCASLKCPVCGNGSCTGGGCQECMKDYPAWKLVKNDVSNYLTEQEFTAYQKGLELQRIIVASIARGENEVDWKGLLARGELSNMTQGWFQNLIDKAS